MKHLMNNVSFDTLLLRICRLHDRLLFNHTDVLALNAASVTLTCTGQTHLFCGVLFLCSRSVQHWIREYILLTCSIISAPLYFEIHILKVYSNILACDHLYNIPFFLLKCMHLLEHRVSPYVQFSVLVNKVLLFKNSNFQWYIEVECLWKSQQMLGQI